MPGIFLFVQDSEKGCFLSCFEAQEESQGGEQIASLASDNSQAFDNLKSSVPSPGWVELSKPRDRRAGNAPDRKISVAGRRPQDQGGLKCTPWSQRNSLVIVLRRAGGKGGRGPAPSPYLDPILIKICFITWKITLYGILKPQYEKFCEMMRRE